MTIVNSTDVANAIREVAAQYIRPRFNALQPEDIRTKSGPNDLVTKADTEAEEALDIILPKILPGSVVLGEEGLSAGRYSLEDMTKQSGYVWVVDPVDGTRNFAHSVPLFATMVALTYNGETIMSWIYDVMADEMIAASKGEGTTLNGARMVMKPRSPSAGVLAYIHPTLNRRMGRQLPDSPHLKWKHEALFATSHEYIRLLKGVGDIGFYRRLMPWDHVAGVLAVQEAGGLVQTWHGEQYGVRIPPEDSGLLATNDPALLQVMKPYLEHYKRTHKSV